MPTSRWRLKSAFALVASITFCASTGKAIDLFPVVGMVDRTPASGCCRKMDSQMGFGMLTRFPTNSVLGDIEMFGFSDFRWSEVSAAKFIYILGEAPKVDPVSTPELTIKRFTMWTMTLSYGAGFFTHNTRTTGYNLPTLVTGGELVSRGHLTYHINDSWFAGGLLSFALAFSAVDASFNTGLAFGLGYRF